uniref:CD93 molecule n=1 Tax=Nothobranchius pienaari TaxID=704102 RepID=A0A1A8M9K2_9TELE
MLLIVLLQIISSIEVSLGADEETLCTSNACFTLHAVQLSFEKARLSCEDNGGYLMTVRDRDEEHELLSLLRLKEKHHSNGFRLWIGLRLKEKDCVLPDETLRGFKWILGEEDSQYSNWEKEPASTCTERCVKAKYVFSSPEQLKWTDGGCRSQAFYACRFYFKGMCEPLALTGPGRISYTPPFSKKPQKGKMKLYPVGTFAVVYCGGREWGYSVCHDTNSWNNPGPFCELETQNCGTNNGGCEHLCQQKMEAFQCSCRDGYELEEDGFSCRKQNLCGPRSCEYECVTGESGYSCKCPNGFKLSQNQRDCADINECESDICQDHWCENTHGSYTCVCRDGYMMTDGECSDVDECDESRCEHICRNSAGSFSCSCNQGFTLSQDGRSCADEDECLTDPCPAGSTCTNTFGGFLCTNQTETDRTTDGSVETPRVSPTPAAPSAEGPPESLTRTTMELQHQSPHTDTPDLDPVDPTDLEPNGSLPTIMTKSMNSRVMVCVLGSVVPLLLLVALTLFIIIFRSSCFKKEEKKKTTADGYCWVSSGLDPRLEKLYESIQTDDL